MQTFLPFRDFEFSARALDYQRLNKQRSECKQILIALTYNRGWIHHTATRMWRNHRFVLCKYALTCCRIWKDRGHVDNVTKWIFEEEFVTLQDGELIPGTRLSGESFDNPWWLGLSEFHMRHRSKLFFKKPDYYEKYFPELVGTRERSYMWPSRFTPRPLLDSEIDNEHLRFKPTDSGRLTLVEMKSSPESGPLL